MMPWLEITSKHLFVTVGKHPDNLVCQNGVKNGLVMTIYSAVSDLMLCSSSPSKTHFPAFLYQIRWKTLPCDRAETATTVTVCDKFHLQTPTYVTACQERLHSQWVRAVICIIAGILPLSFSSEGRQVMCYEKHIRLNLLPWIPQ